MKVMVAKYDGTCCECRKPIRRGQQIKFFGRGTAAHGNCLAPNGETNPANVVAPCWICGDSNGLFRQRGAATPVWCDACNERENAKTKTVGNVRFNASAEDYCCSDAAYEDACARACGL